MAELRSWVLARLLWNPAQDPERLREEFLRGYFGPAAGPIGDYLKLLEKAVLRAGDPLGCYSPPEAKFLSAGTLAEAWSFLKKAERKAAANEEYARRVRLARLPAAYAVLARWDELKKDADARRLAWPWPGSRDELLRWFVDAARAENVTMISEWQSFDDWAAKGGRRK
jgi:hypothetical protein